MRAILVSVLTMDDDDTEYPRADILVRDTRIADIGPDP